MADQQENHIHRQADLMAQIGHAAQVCGAQFFPQRLLCLLDQHVKLAVAQHVGHVLCGILRPLLGRQQGRRLLGLNQPQLLKSRPGRLQTQGAHVQALHQLLRRQGSVCPHQAQIQ